MNPRQGIILEHVPLVLARVCGSCQTWCLVLCLLIHRLVARNKHHTDHRPELPADTTGSSYVSPDDVSQNDLLGYHVIRRVFRYVTSIADIEHVHLRHQLSALLESPQQTIVLSVDWLNRGSGPRALNYIFWKLYQTVARVLNYIFTQLRGRQLDSQFLDLRTSVCQLDLCTSVCQLDLCTSVCQLDVCTNVCQLDLCTSVCQLDVCTSV
ncbi:hypothetical protein Btru_067414 [Bulinus truncatus]|nr:hypothetical protein Btru_067414 [Bulinus truncatus]